MMGSESQSVCRVIWWSENGHGEVANENPLMLPCTLSIVGALVLLKRRAGKKNASSAFRLA